MLSEQVNPNIYMMDLDLQSRQIVLSIQSSPGKPHLYSGVDLGISFENCGHTLSIRTLMSGGLERFRCGVPVPSHISTLMLDHSFAHLDIKKFRTRLQSLFTIFILMTD